MGARMFRYSLGKSKGILKWCYNWYRKKWRTLNAKELADLESKMERLDAAILAGQKKEAGKLAKQLEKFGKKRIRTSANYIREVVFALLFALVLAIVIRQVWFEFYEIPTGSMRPTFKEKDRLIVRKSTFSINVPLLAKHFYFDPDLVKRGNYVIWSGANIDLPNTDTYYFGFIPYKKQYIKRLIGKPGDTLYFYGGKIYGIDKNGNEIIDLIENPSMEKIEHIPFISFEGRTASGSWGNQVVFRHFNQPVGRVLLKPTGEPYGEVFDGTEWEKESKKRSYFDAYGIGNFAMARILTRSQLKELTPFDPDEFEDAPLYLELQHHPNFTHPRPEKLMLTPYVSQIILKPFVSILPITQKQIDKMTENMYTSRFVVSNGLAENYTMNSPHFSTNSPALPGVKDGTYDIYYGIPYKIKWGGISERLSPDHPLTDSTPENLQKLFNLGIKFSKIYQPTTNIPLHQPQRYAYFRDGDLYLLGAPIYTQEDPLLKDFIQKEKERAKNSTPQKPYYPFVDNSPPFKNGKIDHELLNEYGLKIPEGHYLVLGDNHANSGDSRFFGFVPAENLQGTPSFILWPAGKRWGFSIYSDYSLLTLPNIIVTSIVLIALIIWYILHRKNLKTPIYKKLS